MKKLASLAMVVLMCLMVSTAMAADKPKKCEVPNMTSGAFEVPGLGYGSVMFHHPEKELQTITVLKEVDVPAMDDQGNETTVKMYKFSATYDNTYVFCMGHGFGHPVTEFPGIPSTAYDHFLVEVELVKCK